MLGILFLGHLIKTNIKVKHPKCSWRIYHACQWKRTKNNS